MDDEKPHLRFLPSDNKMLRQLVFEHYMRVRPDVHTRGTTCGRDSGNAIDDIF